MQQIAQVHNKLCRDRAVDQTVIIRKGQAHDLMLADIALVIHDQLILDRAHAEDTGIGLIDDRREGLDAEHAEQQARRDPSYPRRG